MPPITRILLILNVGIYVYLTFLRFSNEDSIRSIYESFGLVPIDFLEGSFWQPLTSMFLHYPYFPLHLMVNMLGLWSLGSFLERQIGSTRFLWLYTLAGLFASLLVVFVPYSLDSYEDMARPTVGASGALMGLLGGVAVLCPRAKLFLLFFPMQARTAALLLALLSLLMALFDSSSFSISHSGHLGGLLGGFLYAKLALLPDLQSGLKENFRAQINTSKKSNFSTIWPQQISSYLHVLKQRNYRERKDKRIEVQFEDAVWSESSDRSEVPQEEKLIPPLNQEYPEKDTPKQDSSLSPSKESENFNQIEDRGKKENQRLLYDPHKKRFYYKE